MPSIEELMAKVPQLKAALTTYEAARPNHVPMDIVNENVTFPFSPHQFQTEAVNDMAWRPRIGLYLEMGLGKTFVGTAISIYKLVQGADIVICLMPPILITGWRRWLSAIPQVDVESYVGSPAVRKSLTFDHDFMLMSYQIFKIDLERIREETKGKKVVLLLDEATAIKNPGSDTHRKVFDFAVGQEVILMTGSPLSKPEDSFAYCKFVAPGVYRSLGHWHNLHVASTDFFGNIAAYRDLEKVAENMKINAVRVLTRDVIKDLPEIRYMPLHYSLDHVHYRLYEKLANEQLLTLESGGKIDGTTPQALFHALAQIIVNYGHFSGDESDISKGVELVTEKLEELGDGKLLVFTNYRMTNQLLQENFVKYGVRTVFGDTSPTDRQKKLDQFINDPACRLLVMQVNAGGLGVDGLQHVCNNVMFLEFPTTPFWFHQAVARLMRIGQKDSVNVWIAVAEGTCQERQFKNLMSNDALVNKVIRNFKDLRDAVFGK